MMFILRVIFWLAVMSAILPPRQDGGPGVAETAGRAVGAAMDYCAQNANTCLGQAAAAAEAMRIPAEFVLRAQANAQAASPAPLPKPRPAAL